MMLLKFNSSFCPFPSKKLETLSYFNEHVPESIKSKSQRIIDLLTFSKFHRKLEKLKDRKGA